MRAPHPALLLALAALCAAACQPAAAGQPRSPRPSPPASNAPAEAVLRPPAQAVLEDGEVGLPRLSGRDHLSAAEAARDAPDEVSALDAYAGWGWADAASRAWGGSGRSVQVLVLLTLRPEGAERALERWSLDAVRAPLASAACPQGMPRLDGCVAGAGAGRMLVAGRLDAGAFRLEGSAADVARLAPLQARRLSA
jgi:hypothetical protein